MCDHLKKLSELEARAIMGLIAVSSYTSSNTTTGRCAIDGLTEFGKALMSDLGYEESLYIILSASAIMQALRNRPNVLAVNIEVVRLLNEVGDLTEKLPTLALELEKKNIAMEKFFKDLLDTQDPMNIN